MAKRKDNAPGKLREQAREQLAELGYEKLIEDFQLFDPFGDGSMDVTADLVAMDGDEPVVLFAATDPGGAALPPIQDDAKFKAGLGADEGKPFRFVWVWDGDNHFVFDLEKDAQISDLPRKDLWREIAKPISDSRSRLLQDLSAEYHRGDFRAIQRKFDQLHDAIYSRGGIKPTNAAIDELGKLLFLRIHLEKSPRYKIKDGAGKGKLFSEIYSSKYVKKNGKKSVIELKDAFREINNLPQYNAKDITGEVHTIFAYDEPLRLENTDILAMAIDSMDLRDRDGQPIRLSVPDKELVGNGEQARMMRAHLIHEDLLGWAFDVFLRGKYASNEGLATYLTPSQVVECMTNMVFHDITDAELWARRGDKDQQERWGPGKDEKDLPAFLCGDICCGTGRFIVGALREIKKRILDDKHVGHSDDDKLAWLSQMKRHSFFGADQAEGSIQKARINMLLYGEDHSQLLKVDDSITDAHVDKLVGKFDLILTNPPFGKGKYDNPKGLARSRDVNSGLELGWSWKNGNRDSKKKLDKADPAALFIDRNLQLLKPGGRLVIVVPDGILCNSDDEYIREYILGMKDKENGEFLGGKAILKAVVSLPNETFSISGTNTKTSFIYIQKKKHSSNRQGNVFAAVAEHVGYIKKGKAEVPDPAGNDLVNISNCYKNDKSIPDSFRLLCRTVPKDELLVRWMNAGYYRQVYADIKQSLVNKGFSLVELGDLARCNRKKSKPDGDIFYIEIGDLDTATGTIVGGRKCSPADTPNNARRIIKRNDVLMSTRRPDRGAVALVEESYEGSFCSVFLAKIQVIANKVKPGFLQQYLRTDVAKLFIAQRCTETTYPVISEDDIETIPVPVIDSTIQNKISENTQKAATYQRAAEELRKESNEIMHSILNGGPDSLISKELEGI